MFNINPKCVKMGELYGETNPNTLEWTDGLLASAVRKFAKEDVVHGMEDQSVDARSSTAMSGTQSRGRSSVTGVSVLLFFYLFFCNAMIVM